MRWGDDGFCQVGFRGFLFSVNRILRSMIVGVHVRGLSYYLYAGVSPNHLKLVLQLGRRRRVVRIDTTGDGDY